MILLTVTLILRVPSRLANTAGSPTWPPGGGGVGEGVGGGVRVAEGVTTTVTVRVIVTGVGVWASCACSAAIVACSSAIRGSAVGETAALGVPVAVTRMPVFDEDEAHAITARGRASRGRRRARYRTQALPNSVSPPALQGRY